MKKIYERLNVIGCDETGVGDYLTPLVASAVFVPWQNTSKLIQLGVTDSKKLSDLKIKALAVRVKPLVIAETKHLTQKGYNKLNASLNANELKTFLHLANINKIEARVQDSDVVIIDQFANDKSFQKYLARLKTMSFGFKAIRTKAVKLVIQGELEHVAVATASVLARARFLDLMTMQNRTWKTTFPLGTNKQVESFATAFVEKHGRHQLSSVAKLKFKTTQKILK